MKKLLIILGVAASTLTFAGGNIIIYQGQGGSNPCGGVDTDSQSIYREGDSIGITRGNKVYAPIGGGASGWSLNGNAINSGDFLGTTNSAALSLKVENKEVALFNPNNSSSIGYLTPTGADNTIILGSINGVGGASSSTSIGIGTFEPTSRLHIDASISYKTKVVSTSYTVDESDNIIIFDGLAGQTITLPLSFGCYGRTYKLVNVTNPTISASASVNIAVNPLFDFMYDPASSTSTTSYILDFATNPTVTITSVYPLGWVIIDK